MLTLKARIATTSYFDPELASSTTSVETAKTLILPHYLAGPDLVD
jgi:hypothetical protein